MDSNTVTTVEYDDWRTTNGSIRHNVTVLITEAVLVWRLSFHVYFHFSSIEYV